MKLTGRKFRAQIGHRGVQIHIGVYETALEAHSAYCFKALELFGEFANQGEPINE